MRCAALALLAAAAFAEDLLEGKPVDYWVKQLEKVELYEPVGEADRVFREAGPKAAAAVPGLVALFDHENRHVRFRATMAAKHVGAPAVPALRKVLLEGSDPAARSAAAALELMGPEAEPAIPELVSAVKTRSGEARGVAAAALGRLRAKEAREAVRAVLADEDPKNRVRAAEAMFRLGEPADACVPVLCAVLALDDGDASASAAGALGRIDPDHPVSLPALLDALESKERRVRVQAVRALAGCRNEAAIVAILSRPSAGDVRKRLGPEAVPALLESLGHRDPEVVREAVVALGRIGKATPEVLRALRRLAREKKHGAAAREALARLER